MTALLLLGPLPQHSASHHSLHALTLVHNVPQMFKELAKPPAKLNKTRGIGAIAAPPQFVADVISYDYEKWDENIKGFKTLTEEHDDESGAVAETSWSRYSLGTPPVQYLYPQPMHSS